MIFPKQAVAASLLLGLAILPACDGPAPYVAPAPETGLPDNSAQVETDRALANNEVSTSVGVRILSAEKRVAVMAGHVAAGIALYRAGEPDQAAAQLESATSSETATERTGFDRFGFDREAFETVHAAATAETPAEEVEEALAAAEANLALMLEAAGMEKLDLILFLLELCGDEYGAGVMDAAIHRAPAYQAAYGYAITARNVARQMEGAGDLVLELELLVRMWPSEGPVMTEAVAPEPAMGTQIARARLAASLL
ncbi:hypothetical protein [Hyphomonas sp.]|jgi:hypothetical protein|uniref:hypothetical protein n=1 Tax=Hyphomonas sp. TaxID=87 RepID=UPI0032D97608